MKILIDMQLTRLINEKIKKIEIEKKYEILQNKNVIKKIISDLYSKIGISNIEEFKKYLKIII